MSLKLRLLGGVSLPALFSALAAWEERAGTVSTFQMPPDGRMRSFENGGVAYLRGEA